MRTAVTVTIYYVHEHAYTNFTTNLSFCKINISGLNAGSVASNWTRASTDSDSDNVTADTLVSYMHVLLLDLDMQTTSLSFSGHFW